MRFKQKVLLFLTSIMLTATVGMINPMEVKAEQSPQSYTKENGGILSVDNLGPATEWTYNETVYEVYNGFISSTGSSSWYDATGFVQMLNDANYDGHNDWQLLDSEDMAKAWHADFPIPEKNLGYVRSLWTTEETNYYRDFYINGYNLSKKELSLYARSSIYANIGFVILRPAFNLPTAQSNVQIVSQEDVEDVADEAQGGEETENLASETAAPDDESEIEDASLTGSVLSGGSLWIIIGVVVVAAIAIIVLVLAKKKQNKSK